MVMCVYYSLLQFFSKGEGSLKCADRGRNGEEMSQN